MRKKILLLILAAAGIISIANSEASCPVSSSYRPVAVENGEKPLFSLSSRCNAPGAFKVQKLPVVDYLDRETADALLASRKNKVKRAPGDKHILTVKPNIVDDYLPLFFGYAKYGDRGWSGEQFPGVKPITIDISDGTYTMVALFQCEIPGVPVKVVVLENFSVTSDTTVSFDSSLATELVEMAPVLPDGKQITGPLVSDEWELLEEGTVYSKEGYGGYYCNYLMHSVFGNITQCEENFIRQKDGEKVIDFAYGGNFMFNPGVSDRFSVSQIVIQNSRDGETAYQILSHSNGVGAQKVSNKTSDFTSVKKDDIYTTDFYNPAIKISEKTVNFGYTSILNGLPSYMNYGEGPLFENAENISLCCPNPSDGSIPAVAVAPYVTNVWDGILHDDGDGYQWASRYSIFPALLKQTTAGIENFITPLINGYYGCDIFNNPNGYPNSEMIFNGNPSFGFVQDGRQQRAGTSTPIIFLKNNSMQGGISFQFDYVDRTGAGPRAETDEFPAKIEVTYGDKKLNSQYDDQNTEKIYTFFDELNQSLKNSKDKINVKLTVYDTFVIDSLFPMKSVKEATFNYAEVDNRPPTLSMLQFRDLDGNVTDRFDKASDGTLNFSAADLDYSVSFVADGINSYYFYVGKPKVNVEYAPVNSSNWTPLTVTELPDNFFIPSYGNFFTASLENVNRKGNNGWFDLRISLKDASGNEEVTTISPAFKIGNLAGIDGIESDGNGLWINDDEAGLTGTECGVFEIYNPAGLRVKRAEGISVLLNDLPAGIYIIRAITSEGKLFTKKLSR